MQDGRCLAITTIGLLNLIVKSFMDDNDKGRSHGHENSSDENDDVEVAAAKVKAKELKAYYDALFKQARTHVLGRLFLARPPARCVLTGVSSAITALLYITIC